MIFGRGWSSRWKTSSENVENVVYEPRTPIDSIVVISSLNRLDTEIAAVNAPAIRQPNELAKTVPVRNGMRLLMGIVAIDVRYRRVAPIAPPTAINKKSIKVLKILFVRLGSNYRFLF